MVAPSVSAGLLAYCFAVDMGRSGYRGEEPERSRALRISHFLASFLQNLRQLQGLQQVYMTTVPGSPNAFSIAENRRRRQLRYISAWLASPPGFSLNLLHFSSH